MKCFSAPPPPASRGSPPARGAWIEIYLCPLRQPEQLGRPPHGGRGLKYPQLRKRVYIVRRPPHGGRGLKWHPAGRNRRKGCGRPPHGGRGLKFWLPCFPATSPASRPPHGGRGLKFTINITAIMFSSRPPHGGRGLKCERRAEDVGGAESPPARGAWIEITP